MKTDTDGREFLRVILGAAFSLFLWPVAAARADCQASAAAPSFTIGVLTPPATYKLNEATEELSARARENGTALDRGSRLLGLTVNQYDLHVAVAVAASDRCAALQETTITAFPDIEVLVDGRFKPGSCQQRAIIDHENEHVAVFREAIAYYRPAMEDALRQARLPAALPAVTGRDADQDYVAMIRRVLAPVLEAVRDRAQEANNRIDTAQHYAEVFRRCPNWD